MGPTWIVVVVYRLGEVIVTEYSTQAAAQVQFDRVCTGQNVKHVYMATVRSEYVS